MNKQKPGLKLHDGAITTEKELKLNVFPEPLKRDSFNDPLKSTIDVREARLKTIGCGFSPKNPIQSAIKIVNENSSCKYCSKQYSSKGMANHVKACKKKQENQIKQNV
jgi:hypothetical protein